VFNCKIGFEILFNKKCDKNEADKKMLCLQSSSFLYDLLQNNKAEHQNTIFPSAKSRYIEVKVGHYYRAFHGFGQAKFPDGGLALGWSQFSILPQLHQKMILASKGVKIN